MDFLTHISLPINVLQTVGAIFILLLAGYGAKRTGVLKQADTSVVNAIILYLTMPAFIFTAIYQKPVPRGVGAVVLVVILSEIAVVGLAYLIGRLIKLDRRTTGGLMVAAAFGNTGFLGYPVTIAAWPNKPEALVTSVMIDNFCMAMFLYSLGVAVAATFGSAKFDRRKMFEFLRLPFIPATILSLLLRNSYVPEPIVIAARYMAAATIPLAMVSLGLSLSTSSMRGMTAPFLACFCLKMVVLPVLVLLGLKGVGINGIVRDVAIIEASMPSAVMSGVVAGQYGANGPFVSGAIFLMTLFSLGTIPVVLTLLH